MSTFFRSAAMTLLSRTLQLFLQQYLSDVDVEGVALPSLYTSDGHSGWGVRLSNVQLREGAVLLKGPGSKQRPPHSSQPKNKVKNKTTVPTSSSNGHGNSQAGSSSPPPSYGSASSSDTPFNSSKAPESGSLQTEDAPQPVPPPSRISRSQSLPPSVHIETLPKARSEERIRSETMPVAETVDSIDTNITPSTSSPASTPKSSSSSSWFSYSSWYPYSTTKKPPKDVVADAMDPAPLPAATAVEDTTSSSWASGNEPRIDPLVGTLPTQSSRPAHQGGKKIAPTPVEDCPMILRLGKNGRISILDVRLIGKNIHVLVEDAFITLEVVRVTGVPGHKEDSNGIGTATSGAPASTPQATDRKRAVPTPAPPSKKIQELKSVGDRVLAEIALARIVSGIPNLFLRDVRIRLVIRDEMEVASSTHTGSDLPPLHEPKSSDECQCHDTVLDLSIDFLSVTDGEDFLAKFRPSGDDDAADDHDDDADSERDDEHADQVSNMSGVERTNDFHIKRIRTGRGPEGGITLKMFSGGDFVAAASLKRQPQPSKSNPLWARDNWIRSTDFYALRLSGLDIMSRVFLGARKDVSVANNSSWYGDFDDFRVDSMLFGGVDYIAPGPQPPLPPIAQQDALFDEDDKPWAIPGAKTYLSDLNGIQSCGVPSSFHRVARGMKPAVCSNGHLPCEYCADCWTFDPGSSRKNSLDHSTPMAGLVMHVSMRDILEINLDRRELEVIGLLLDLFVKNRRKKEMEEDSKTENVRSELTEMNEISSRSVLTRTSSGIIDDASFRSTHSSLHLMADENGRAALSRSSSRLSEDHREMNMSQRSLSGMVLGNSQNEQVQDDITSSFPKYMQPEKIQILGLHLSEVRLRVHIMRPDYRFVPKHSFAYWDFCAKCVTMDYQSLSTYDKPFQDIRLDVGHLTVAELKGLEREQLISMGIRQRVVEFDEMTVETLMTRDENSKRSPWPSTASALLDMPPPLETLVYEARERHAVQLRYVTAKDSSDGAERILSSANLRLGPSSVELPYAIHRLAAEVISEARSTVLGAVEAGIDGTTVKKKEDLEIDKAPTVCLLTYRAQIDGGRIHLEPLINVSLPVTTFTGTRSTETGFMIDAILNQAKVMYGTPATMVGAHQKSLSLQQLADLPENVRLRILLFMKDLKPLETALGIKPETNSFLRCRAVNKGIVRAARKVGRSITHDVTSSRTSSNNRRHEMLTELMKLDDKELSRLMKLYQQQAKTQNR